MPTDTTRLYYEAHITFEPAKSEGYTYENFASGMRALGWRASKFEHDDVDGIAGKWFVSARDKSYSRLKGRVVGMVNGLSYCGKVMRYKIEETMLDSKEGDTL